jgi:endonuclease/exonuclease/phosphatase (EEP) superfamily protein YafD
MALRFLNFIVISTAVCTLLGFLSAYGWVFHLCSHFRVQYLAILLICALLFLIRKDFVLFGVCSILLAANAMTVYPQFTAKRSPPGSGETLRIVQMNVFVGNRNFQAIDSFLRSSHADVIGVEEFNDAIARGLEALGTFKQYPYQIRVHNSGEQSDIVLFSKVPFQSQSINYNSIGKDPTIIASIEHGGKTWTIALMHPRPPGLPLLLKRQQEQFERLEAMRSELGRNLVVIGDLNTSPWATQFSMLVNKLGLRDSRSGYGLAPSWPAMVLPLMLPIDFVLVSNAVQVRTFFVGPFTGSDHLPLVVDVIGE